LDTGYPALISDLPTEKLCKNDEKLQSPASEDPSLPVIMEEQGEEGTTK